jgi:hypothetical protein
MSDPAVFTVEGIEFKALPSRAGIYYFWQPRVAGIAFSIFKLPSGERPYSVNKGNYASLEAAARGAIERRHKEIETWRQAIADYDSAIAGLNEHKPTLPGDR